MANIKISELNELYNAQKDYGDYVPIVDTSANETKKISVQNLIPSNVEIIAITDTEPIEYETGDKYYNTTNNRIYTATSGGWINPQEPIKGILYIILEEQKSYTYDGTTLISVGGGAGGIVVYPNIPDEDTQLYIEEEDLDGQYLPVDEDIYSTTETKTNKIWVIDGVNYPVYRKEIIITNPTTGSWQSYNMGISNIKRAIIEQAYMLRGGSYTPLPNYTISGSTTYEFALGLDYTNSYLQYNIKNYTGITEFNTTIEYVKNQ